MRFYVLAAAVVACHSDSPDELLNNNDVSDLDLFEDPGEGVVFDLDVSADPELIFTGFGLMGSPQYGTWTAYDARAVQRGEGFESLDIEVVVDMTSVETGNSTMTRHLKTSDFFDADNHPQARFEALSLVHDEGDVWRVNGTLTLRETTADWSWQTTIVQTEGALHTTAHMSFSRWDWGLYPASADGPGDDGVGDEVLLDYDLVLVVNQSES